MIGLTSLEVYKSIFNITTTINKFELYTDTFEKISCEDFKDELEEIFNSWDITPHQLQHEIKSCRFIQAYMKKGNRKIKHWWLFF